MSLHGAISDKLSADVAAISGRAYRVRLPQNPTYPCCVYGTTAATRLHDLDGPTGQGEPLMTIDCWADTHTAAKSVADAVRVSLDGFSGTEDGTAIGSILVESERDGFDPETGKYVVALDSVIFHDE